MFKKLSIITFSFLLYFNQVISDDLKIVYVDVDTLDETLDKDEVFGTVEAVKTVSDLFMPLTGEIVEFNEELEDDPELVNTDPYEKGWMIKIKLSVVSEIENLLNAAAYKELIGA